MTIIKKREAILSGLKDLKDNYIPAPEHNLNEQEIAKFTGIVAEYEQVIINVLKGE